MFKSFLSTQGEKPLSCTQIMQLSNSGIDVKASMDNFHNTFLHKAAALGLVDIIIYLLDKGIDINCQNKSLETPLIMAVKNGQVAAVTTLLERKAATEITNIYGNTAVHFAACNQNYLILRLLIKAGCNLDVTNKYTNATPLLLATSKQIVTNVKLLLRNGANVNATNKQGLSATDIAIKINNPDILNLLLFWGANIPNIKTTLEPILNKYRNLRAEGSITVALMSIHREQNKFPSLQDIVGLFIVQNSEFFSRRIDMLSPPLKKLINYTFPKKLQAGLFFKVHAITGLNNNKKIDHLIDNKITSDSKDLIDGSNPVCLT